MKAVETAAERELEATIILQERREEVTVMHHLITAEVATGVIKIHQLDAAFPSITLEHWKSLRSLDTPCAVEMQRLIL